jgi:hypothetical protein
MAGCSNKNSNQKTEEQLKIQVVDDMEAESKSEAIDVTNNDELYEFINETYPNKYTREDFDKWTAFYMDITKDGNDEVVFTTTYFDGNLEYAIFITGDEGEYKIIPSDIILSKYENSVVLEDGLILISLHSGGSGIRYKTIAIYVYDGKEIKYTETSIVKEDIVANENGYLTIGEMSGGIKNFLYTATKEDYIDGEKEIIEVSRYVYNPETMTFDIEVIQSNENDKYNDKASNTEANNTGSNSAQIAEKNEYTNKDIDTEGL